jgi:hypothetical protein
VWHWQQGQGWLQASAATTSSVAYEAYTMEHATLVTRPSAAVQSVDDNTAQLLIVARITNRRAI